MDEYHCNRLIKIKKQTLQTLIGMQVMDNFVKWSELC